MHHADDFVFSLQGHVAAVTAQQGAGDRQVQRVGDVQGGDMQVVGGHGVYLSAVVEQQTGETRRVANVRRIADHGEVQGREAAFGSGVHVRAAIQQHFRHLEGVASHRRVQRRPAALVAIVDDSAVGQKSGCRSNGVESGCDVQRRGTAAETRANIGAVLDEGFGGGNRVGPNGQM